jgi:AraC-like DNA-binding protein
VILDHELVLVLRGDGEFLTDSCARSFAPGDLILIPPCVPHRFAGRARHFEHIAVHFDLTVHFLNSTELRERKPYAVFINEGLTLSPHEHVADVDPRRSQLERLVRHWADNTPLGTLKAEAALMEVVTSLLHVPHPESPVRAPMDARIERALAEIARHLAEPLRVEELARAVKLGITQFTRLFREQVGEPPAAYQRRLRLRRARELLEEREISVKAVAFACGYRNSAHFSRAYFATYGQWPTQQRR